MAVTAITLQSGYLGSDATSYATAALTGAPTANRLQLLAVASSRNAADPSVPSSVTGCSLTWVEIGTVLYRGGSGLQNYRHTLYRALGTPIDGAVTFDFGAETQSSLAYSWVEFSGVHTTGTNGSGAVVQVVTAQGASTLPTATLAPFASVGNAGYLVVAQRANTSFTPEAGWTELHDIVGTAPVMALTSLWQPAAADTTPSTTSISSNEWGAFAVEIKEAAAATSLSVPLPMAFLDPTSDFAFGAFFRDVNAAIDPGAGFTELADIGMATPPFRLAVEQRTGEDLTVDAADTGANEASSWLGLAAEFRVAVAESVKPIVPAGIASSSAVTGSVFVAIDKDIAPTWTMGPFPFFFNSDEAIQSRSTVSASIFKTVAGGADKAIVPSLAGIDSRATVSAELTGNRAVIPATVNSRATVSAVLTGGTPPFGEIDFTPETKAATALQPGADTFPSATTFPGSFRFRPMRED